MPFFRNTKREPVSFDTANGNARSIGGRAEFEVDKTTSMLPMFRHYLNIGRIEPAKVSADVALEPEKAVAPVAPPPVPTPPVPVPEPPVSEPATDSPGPTEPSTDDSEKVAPEDAQDPPKADTEESETSGEPEPPREGATKPKKRRKNWR